MSSRTLCSVKTHLYYSTDSQRKCHSEKYTERAGCPYSWQVRTVAGRKKKKSQI